MKKIALLLCIAAFSFQLYGLEIVKYNGDKETISVSNNSVNKLVFPSDVTSKAYSKEKGLQVEVNKNEVYVKYTPEMEQSQVLGEDGKPINSSNKLAYKKAMRAELFVTTETGSYLFVLNPQTRDAETFKIIDPEADKKKAYEFESRNEYTQTLNNLLTSAFDLATGFGKEPPAGYEIKELKSESIPYSPDFLVTPKYKLSGEQFIVYVFEVKNITAKEVRINPRLFAKLPLKGKLAIGALDESAAPYQKTYISITTLKNGDR